MKSVGKYVIGGLVGAVVGFLIAPKRAQLVRDALFNREREHARVLQRVTTAQSRSAAVAPVTPVLTTRSPATSSETYMVRQARMCAGFTPL